MPKPMVSFSSDSGSFMDCVGWLASNVVNGQLAEEAKRDATGTHLVLARTINGLLERFTKPTIMGDDPAIAAALDSLRDAMALPVPAGAGPAGLGGGMLMKLLLDALMKLLAEWLANQRE